MYDEEENITEDCSCPKCGLRQYGNVCAICNTKIKNEEETEKKEDDYDEYDWREKR